MAVEEITRTLSRVAGLFFYLDLFMPGVYYRRLIVGLIVGLIRGD